MVRGRKGEGGEKERVREGEREERERGIEGRERRVKWGG